MNRRDFLSLITKAIALSPVAKLAKYLPHRNYSAPLSEALSAEGTLLAWVKLSAEGQRAANKKWLVRVFTWGMDAENGVRVMREYRDGKQVGVTMPAVDPLSEAKRIIGKPRTLGTTLLSDKSVSDSEVLSISTIDGD